MMLLLHGKGEERSSSRKEPKMPKFVLAAVVGLFRHVPHGPPRCTPGRAAETLGVTCERPKGHEPYVDLGPLDLTRRH
jgi:hypothetical protein